MTKGSQNRISKKGDSVTVHIPRRFPAWRRPETDHWPDTHRGHNASRRHGTAEGLRAHRWREMLENGKYSCAADLAKDEKINASYLSRILRLTLLSPDIVKAIVTGRQLGTLQADDLLRPPPSCGRSKNQFWAGRSQQSLADPFGVWFGHRQDFAWTSAFDPEADLDRSLKPGPSV
jgi:hypothetical protein